MIQEQVIRRVTPIGNGAHILAPRGWVGDEVVIVRKPKQSAKEKILAVLDSYLENVAGIYLYGSRARGEEEEDSDIDLFVVTNSPIKIKEDGFEIVIVEENKVGSAIKFEPLVMYAILSEARPIINSILLKKLKDKYKPKLNDFREFLESTKRIIAINKEFLEAEKGEFSQSHGLAYSIILRLRGIFIMNQILSGKIYYHKKFRAWIKKHCPLVDYESVYGAYKASKNNSKQFKVKVGDLNKLLIFLKGETLKLQILYDKKKKTSSKRN